MKFLQVLQFYPDYLNDFYRRNPQLSSANYNDQITEFINDGFGAIHTISPYMKDQGYESNLIISNSNYSQMQWIRENRISFDTNQNLIFEITRRQIETIEPDIIYFLDPITFDSRFIRTLTWKPKLIIGWRAANIPPHIDWSEFDIMLSSLKSLRQAALTLGAKSAEHFSPGFPLWIYDRVKDLKPQYDVVFSGQWTLNQHPNRNKYIKEIAKAAADPGKGFRCAFYLSGQANTITPDVKKYDLGGRFGIEMFRALRSGRIALDARGILEIRKSATESIDLAGKETANMRIFEVTGCGVFLLTEYFENIKEYFNPGKEIETFKDEKELIEKISFYSAHPEERDIIAQKGQERCFRDYSMTKRAEDFDRIIQKHLKLKSQNSTPEKTAETISISADPKDPYDIAYEWGWNNPKLHDLVYLCYKTPNFADNARRYYMGPELQEAVRVLSELGKAPDKNTRVLDFGCGNGVASYALARMGYSVVGLDSSLGEIAGLNAAKKIQGLDGVNFEIVHATGEKIDFPENSFDIVWIRETLHHIRGLTGFLKEIWRVLKPSGILCTFRDHVVWNEGQRRHFFATHPFNHITKDENCYYLHEYVNAFKSAGFIIEKQLAPPDSVINTYPGPFRPGIVFDENRARARTEGNDLFSFFVRKPSPPTEATNPAINNQKLQGISQNIHQIPKENLFPNVTFGNNVQIIGLRNLQIGPGSCVGDDTWLNICLRDARLRMKIGKCVLIGRQSVISTGGYLEIADYCVLAPRVYVADSNHIYEDINQPILQQGVTLGRRVIVEENCWLGINSVISGDLTIGRGSVVGANAVVTKNIPPFCVVVGSPIRIIKMYNSKTKQWEKTDSEEDIQQIFKIREEIGLPSREEYQKILQRSAKLNSIDPIVAGRGMNL